MKKIIYIIGLLSLVACKKNIVPKPDHFLDEQQMESLLYDLALLESMKATESHTLDSLQFDAKAFIYRKYECDSTALAQNMVYYASFPKQYDQIVHRVDERLKAQRDSLNKEMQSAPPIEPNIPKRPPLPKKTKTIGTYYATSFVPDVGIPRLPAYLWVGGFPACVLSQAFC